MDLTFAFDVWANWADGFSKGYNIPSYFEWASEDEVELIERVPILHVSTELFDYIKDKYGELPEKLLELVHNKAYQIRGNKKVMAAYVFIISDGKQVLMVDTDGETKPTFKSNIILRQEEYVIDAVSSTPVLEFDWENPDKDEDLTLGGQILSLKSEYMTGLTRKEREMKEIVMDCLFNVSCSQSRAEVVYWYVELFPHMYAIVHEVPVSNEMMVQEMFDFLKQGWSDQHKEFGTQLVKYFDIFDGEWTQLSKKVKVKGEK